MSELPNPSMLDNTWVNLRGSVTSQKFLFGFQKHILIQFCHPDQGSLILLKMKQNLSSPPPSFSSSLVIVTYFSESKDDLYLCVIALVVPSVIFTSLSNGMPPTEGSTLLPFLFLSFVSFLVCMLVSTYGCNFQSVSDVRMSGDINSQLCQ